VTRSRPVEIEFGSPTDPELFGHLVAVKAGGTGWINMEPIIEEEYEPPGPGPFAFLGGSTHKVPTITWKPARPTDTGVARPTEIGIQHAAGPHLTWTLRDLGLLLPEGWRLRQDHPRRGLVADVPPDADDQAVVAWLLQAATAACTVPTTGRWRASVFAGLAR
jgi:hypothetical protein